MHFGQSNDTPGAGFLKIRAALAAVLLCLPLPALVQEWIPPKCCPATDCNAADPASVVEVRGGYAVEGVEGIIPSDDPRIQLSHDGQYHACLRSQARPGMRQTQAILAGSKNELKCLFVPLMG